MHDTRDAHHLQHAVPVIGFAEFFVLFVSPGIGTGAPTIGMRREFEWDKKQVVLPHDVENDDALDGRQINGFTIDFQVDFFTQILVEASAHHLL